MTHSTKVYIVVQTTFEGIHSWPGCPHEDVAFLRNPHRHIFHVKMKFEVTHDDRELEFIKVKREVTQYIHDEMNSTDMGSMSCEMIALDLLTTFPHACFASVYEDGENGAEVVQFSNNP
jgi:hypothetical protein